MMNGNSCRIFVIFVLFSVGILVRFSVLFTESFDALVKRSVFCGENESKGIHLTVVSLPNETAILGKRLFQM